MDAIKRAHIAVLLVSRNFLNSDFIREVELPRIERRFEAGELIVVPILVGHCNWQGVKLLSRPQMVPGKPTPLISYLDSPGEWDRVQEDIFCAIETQVERVREKYNLPKPAPRRSAHDIATTVTRLGGWWEYLPPREDRATSESPVHKAGAVPERKPKRWLLPAAISGIAAVLVAGFAFRGTIFGEAPAPNGTVQAEQSTDAPPAPLTPAIPAANTAPTPSNAGVPANVPAVTPAPQSPMPASTVAPTPSAAPAPAPAPVVEREQPVVTAAPSAPSPAPK